jgi:hypothetical protein
MMRRRYRPRTAHAPAAPPDMKRRRLEQVPTGDQLHFSWAPNEAVYGPDPKRDTFWQRLESLYGAGRK